MIHAALDGNYERADQLNAWLSDFFKVCFIETNPIPIKTVMAYAGQCKEIFRLPMCPLEKEEHREILINTIEKMQADIKEGRI